MMENHPLQLGGGGGLAELTALLREERSHMKEERQIMEAKMQALRQEQQAREDRLRQEVEAAKQVRECQLREEVERAKQEVERARPQAADEAIFAEQLEALQARLQAMHTAKLLAEEELGSLEDTIADCIEVLPTADVKDHAVDQTLRMVLLSERMQVDGSFARQLRRKFAA